MHNPIFKKWSKDLNQHLTEESIQLKNKHTQRYAMLYVTRDMQVKTAIQYHFIPIRMAKIQNTVILCIRQDGGDTRMNEL